MIRIGIVRHLLRYPVKSMAGTPTRSAHLGWHGLAGDRRFAFRRVGDRSGFPWLTASRLPELLLYRPVGHDESTGEPLPTHVRTPSGQELELRGEALRREVAARFGSDVELMWLRNGIFDDAFVSVISLQTVAAVGREGGVSLDVRRFRPNVVLETDDAEPFREGGWIDGTLVFGGAEPRVAVRVTANDVRCMMINLDPDSARQDARVLRAVVRRNGNLAGVYGAAVRTGTVHVGDEVWLAPDDATAGRERRPGDPDHARGGGSAAT
jgi:uncharacterized protein YcbX